MNLLMISSLILVVLYLVIIDRAESQSAGRMTCSQGPQGNPGTPGNHGVPGNNGMPGSPGRDGRDAKGEAGPKGDRGEAGPKGDHGEFGSKGDRGEPGPQSSCPTGVNWKQCVWKRDDNKDNGLIQECNFNKKYIETSLRVFFDGTLRIAGCSTCCKRWYFTFNGAECSGPMTIEGLVYTEATNNIHRHRHIEGYCNNIAVKGKVRVGFWVGDCSSPVGKNVDAYTGWNAVSRIVIQEISHQQPPI